MLLHLSPLLLILLTGFKNLTASSPCSTSPLPARKLFYHNGRQQNVKILTSSQVESRLVGAVFRIFTTEVLGYDVSLVTQPEPVAVVNRESQFRQLASCTNALCDDYNSSPDAYTAPTAMLTLDMWLPPSYHVDTWGLLDAGQLGPAVRFGWFMPNRASKMLPSVDHWSEFKNQEIASTFHPTQEQMNFIEPFLRTPENGFYCTHEHCTDGIFQPSECKKTNNKCGLLVTAYPSNSSIHKTSQVFNQILTEKLLIEVAFFGPNLPRVVDYLETSSSPLDRSYLVLHYAPSVLTMKHSLVPLMFPPSRIFQLMSSRCPFPLVGFGVACGAATGNDDSWCRGLEPGIELEFPK